MTPREYDELAALWGEAFRPDEERELARLARRTPWLAQLSLWAELAAVVMFAVAIGLAIVWRLGPSTLLTGGFILLLLGWSAWRRHHLGSIALLIDETDRLSFIRTSLRAKEAELRRSGIGLALLVPGMLLTLLMGFSLGGQPGQGDLAAFFTAVLSTPRGLVALVFLCCAMLVLGLAHLRLIGETARLRSLLDDYIEQSRREGGFELQGKLL